jgi:hypothetical protein
LENQVEEEQDEEEWINEFIKLTGF